MNVRGVDVTQHQAFSLAAELSDSKRAVCLPQNMRSSLGLWSALLPEFEGDKVKLSSEVQHSRRGMGYRWPAEAQVPVGGDSRLGVGRIPLLCCLSNLRQLGLQHEWSRFSAPLSWTPHGQERCFEQAELLALACKEADVSRTCLVVPEHFNESAQQVLLKRMPEDVRLVPRSMALAVKWCSEQELHLETMKPRGTLICLSLGLDEWELSVVEVAVEQEGGSRRLVPVHQPQASERRLGNCGLGLYRYLFPEDEDVLIWRALQNKGHELLQAISRDGRLASLLTQNVSSQAKLPFEALELMAGLRASQKTNETLERQMWNSYVHQRLSLPVVGIAVGGTFADVHLAQQNMTFGEHCARTLQSWLGDCKTSVYGASVFAEGAAQIACYMEHHMLSYKVALLPLELYTLSKNSLGDKQEHWQTLVESGRMIRAEEDYRQPQEIHGLNIPDGAQELELTLRRSPASQVTPWLYRKVKASIAEKTTRREPVRISCKVRPGQGFAQVDVRSEQEGLFATSINWETMEKCEKPELKLSYIPNVAYIVQVEDMWRNACDAMDTFLFKHEQEMYKSVFSSVLEKDILKIRDKLNKWYKDREFQDIYRYVGALSSDGRLGDAETPVRLAKFVEALEKNWLQRLEWSDKRCADKLLRLGGWLYLYVPKAMQQHVETELQEGNANQVILHVAGLTFHEERQFKLFFNAFCSQESPKAEWFRALRNILRFRDTALSPEVLTKQQVDKILQEMIAKLVAWLINNIQKQAANNCIESFVYLLKRRRYDDNFLADGAETTQVLLQLFARICQEHNVAKYKKLAGAAMKFLNGEATQDSLAAVLEVGDENASDE